MPLACIDSDTTTPLNFFKSFGFRTRIRVVYGLPAAVPDTKYSVVSYPKSERPVPGGATACSPVIEFWLKAGNMAPGPVMGPVTIGSGACLTTGACGAAP